MQYFLRTSIALNLKRTGRSLKIYKSLGYTYTKNINDEICSYEKLSAEEIIYFLFSFFVVCVSR